MTAGRVRTVLGDVPAAELGPTHCHEHLITRPSPAFTRSDPDLVLDDHDAAGRELRAFARAGGGTIVEVSCAEFGRDPAGLAALSRRTGVYVGAATELVAEAQWAGVEVCARTEPELVAEMVEDLTVGFRNAPAVIVASWKAQQRLHHTWWRLDHDPHSLGVPTWHRFAVGMGLTFTRRTLSRRVSIGRVVSWWPRAPTPAPKSSTCTTRAPSCAGADPVHHHRMPRPTIHIG